MEIKIEKKAPAFSLPDSDGNKVSLKDFLGEKVVLYFYPKDNTSGCTTEACNFNDSLKLQNWMENICKYNQTCEDEEEWSLFISNSIKKWAA